MSQKRKRRKEEMIEIRHSTAPCYIVQRFLLFNSSQWTRVRQPNEMVRSKTKTIANSTQITISFWQRTHIHHIWTFDGLLRTNIYTPWPSPTITTPCEPRYDNHALPSSEFFSDGGWTNRPDHFLGKRMNHVHFHFNTLTSRLANSGK